MSERAAVKPYAAPRAFRAVVTERMRLELARPEPLTPEQERDAWMRAKQRALEDLEVFARKVEVDLLWAMGLPPR